MARNIWQVVTDEYYTCPDRSVRPVRAHTIDATQPCDPKRKGVPPPTGAQVIRDLGPGDQAPEAAGQFVQMECISGIWHRAYYQRHRMADGSFRISRPATRLESTNLPCDQPQPPLLPGLAPDAQPAGAPAGETRPARVIRVPGAPQLGTGRVRIELRLPKPTPPQQSKAPAAKSLIGVVLPDTAVAREGTAQITGTVTTEPERYKNVPGLMVQTLGEIELPVDTNGRPTLEGTVVETGIGEPRAASEPFVLTLPHLQPGSQPPAIPTAFTLFDNQTLRSGEFTFKEITTVDTTPVRVVTPEEYATSSLCETGQVTQITGPFDGNGQSTAVKFDDTEARVVAESGYRTFVEAPPELPAGMHKLTVEEETPQGPVQVELPVATMSLGMAADRTELTRGERTNFTVVVNGPEALPRELWQNGTLELRIVRESQNIKMNDEKNGVIVKQLRQRDFANGPYTYKGRIQSLSAGGFRITGILTPKLNHAKGKPVTR